jgi:hypothetical protein
MLVAAQRLASSPVEGGHAADPAADQDRVDGRGRHPEPPGDLDRAQPVTPAQRRDPAHHHLRGPGGAATGPGAAVGHPGRALVPVAGRPLARDGRADQEHPRRLGGGPALLHHQAGQPEPGTRGQRGTKASGQPEAVPPQIHFTTGGLRLSAQRPALSQEQPPWTSHLALGASPEGLTQRFGSSGLAALASSGMRRAASMVPVPVTRSYPGLAGYPWNVKVLPL